MIYVVILTHTHTHTHTHIPFYGPLGFCPRLPGEPAPERCWLGGRKGIRPVKNWVVGCWHGYLEEVQTCI